MSVDHVGLAVADLDAMTSWYAEVLRARVEYRVDRPAVPMTAVVLIDEHGFRFELLNRPGNRPAHARWTIVDSLLSRGYGHVALRVEDVAAEHARLVSLGAASLMTPSPGSQPGMMIAFVADPEDNLVEIVSREGS